jgi:small-conductance mechanosensitive channel
MIPILISVISILIGILLGRIFKNIIFNQLKKYSFQTSGDEIIIQSLNPWIVFWFTLAGIYGALIALPLSAAIFSLLQKILLILAIFSVTMVVAKIAHGFISVYVEKIKEILPTATLFTSLTTVLIFSVGILIILHSLGISIAPILAGLGIGGIAAALAIQETLSNLFSGLQIIFSKQIKEGDYVKLNTGEEGYVVDITWRNTTIRELSNNLIIIPNIKLSQAILKNYNLPGKELAIAVQIGVSYGSDLEKVEKITSEVGTEIMQKIQGGVPEFAPSIRYHAFSDSSINFTVALRGKEFFDQYLITHEFIKKLHKRYHEEGIVIPFPIRTIHLVNDEKKHDEKKN